MLDIIEWIGSVFVKLFTVLDIKIFPDLEISYIQILLGLSVFILLLKLLFEYGSRNNLSIGSSVKSIIQDKKKDNDK